MGDDFELVGDPASIMLSPADPGEESMARQQSAHGEEEPVRRELMMIYEMQQDKIKELIEAIKAVDKRLEARKVASV